MPQKTVSVSVFKKRYKVAFAAICLMEKLKGSKGAILTVAVLLIVVVIVAALFWQSTTPRMLYPEEIRDYQGENLSSISDFRENSIRGPQNVNETTYRLKITGLVNDTIEYTYIDVINGFQKYQKVVTLHCVEGWSVKILWEGLLIKDLLNYTEINPNATVVIFHAYDGYTTALPLTYILDNNILLAYKMNDITLPPERGFPFQLVAQRKYGYKWIKWVTEIELSNNTNYLGYWESRGWPNAADTP